VADDLPYLGYLPEYTTAAWYHQRLAPDLQAKSLEDVYAESQTFADNDYLEALAAGDDLAPAQRTSIIASLSRLTSLSTSYLDANNIRVTVDQFRVQLLRDHGQTLSYYDGRMGAALADPVNQDPYDVFDPLFAAADKNYFGGVLGVTTDLDYDTNNWTSWPGANANGAIQGEYLNSLGDLSALLFDDKQLKVYIASGLYDLECPAAEVEYLIRHLNPQLAARVQIGHYPGGHPIYFSDTAHHLFSQAMATLMGSGAKNPATQSIAAD
jgi:carboxypeptidase C (cathepsin A)